MLKIMVLSCMCLYLSGCTSTEPAIDPADQAATEATFAADLRWTRFGIPHVTAPDWAGLGYGFAYATATDAVCVIAKDIVMVNSRLSHFFGADEGRLESDVFHKAILTGQKLAAFGRSQSVRAQAFNRGYVAGFNRYLRDNEHTLPATCRNRSWLRPITIDDLNRLSIGVGIRYGLGRFQKEIANANPADNRALATNTQWQLPTGIGSNAVAIGGDLSASGRGILLGNPHYPWHGSSRFHLIHTTIPGELDVMGTSLLNTTRVSIGFNNDVAWTHTVSTAVRYTLYQLQLNPNNPLEYLYEGAYRPIEQRTIEVAIGGADGSQETASRSVYFTHYGPIVESEKLAWDTKHAYAIRDAVIDNHQTADTYDALNKAKSTSEVEAAISQQGVYWTNTIAADRHGNALYADISGTPNIDAALLSSCRVSVSDLPARVVILKGHTAACEWQNDPRSAVPGTMPAQEMPRVTRSDYVANSNDSYWLSNPKAPLEGYSPIIGTERSARTLRTRAGLSFLTELTSGNNTSNKLTPKNIQDMLYSQRNYGAELLLDDVLNLCADQPAIRPACDVLSNWDRTMNIASSGGHVWREFWGTARDIENLFATPFDAADPINTPAGINSNDPEVVAALRNALLAAQSTLSGAGIALDAQLGTIQFAQRNDRKIPIPGGQGWAGMFSMIIAELQPQHGYSPIIHGNSYIQVISWDSEGKLQPTAMLTYSQSPEADSPHYSDLTEIYSAGGWIDLPFTDAQIEADPNIRRLSLRE